MSLCLRVIKVSHKVYFYRSTEQRSSILICLEHDEGRISTSEPLTWCSSDLILGKVHQMFRHITGPSL